MVNTDITSINFILKKNDDGREVMECVFEDVTFQLDFTSDNQEYLRSFFMAAIRHLQREKYHFNYVKVDCFSNTSLEEVARDYVTRLNMELDSVYGGLEELNSLNIIDD